MLLTTRLWKIALIIPMLFIFISCTKYKFNKHLPSRYGVWYPSYPINNINITKDDFSDANISFGGGPIKIIAVGSMSWNPYAYKSSYYETALIEVNFSNNSVGRYYARTDWLKANGRIEYTGTKTSFDYFIDDITNFTFSTFGVIVLILFIIFSTRLILKSRKNTTTISDSYSYESNDSEEEDNYSNESDESLSDQSSKEQPTEENPIIETVDNEKQINYNNNIMYTNSDDLKFLALAITNSETRQYDEWVDRIEDDDLKYLALAITNSETRQYDEWVDKIDSDDIKYLALAITNNETRQYDEWVDKIEDDDIKYLALAITNNETRQYDEWVDKIDDDNVKYLALAITNNETRQYDEWVDRID